MIVRPDTRSQLLVTQPDHAALAGRIMEAWRADGLPGSPRRAAILLAVSEHDNGWREADAVPSVDEVTGRILDFVEAPAPVRRGVWPRGIARLAGTPYAAALVAQHALHVYRRFRPEAGWTDFFKELEGERDRNLEAAGGVAPGQLQSDYLFVRLGDLASLTFSNGWAARQTDESGYAVQLEGSHLTITPDPFAGAEVPLAVAARQLPVRRFASAADAAAAVGVAPIVTLTGVASGPRR